MPKSFLTSPKKEQAEAILYAAAQSGRPDYLLEKDVWVVWALRTLFETHLREHLVFKGGTSLSKCFGGVIERFSEDVDLTYDIRSLLPHLKDEDENPIPPSRSQADKWKDQIKERLPAWIEETVIPILKQAADTEGLALKIVQGTGEDYEKVFVAYEPQFSGPAYVKPSIQLEFGARSSGEPAVDKEVRCDAAEFVTALEFPQANVRAMIAERTFWEKVTLAHAFCISGKFTGDRYSRHWHDISRLYRAGYGTRAIEDGKLAQDVANHKSKFYPVSKVDYNDAVSGKLVVVPEGELRDVLADDYAKMLEHGLLLEAEQGFDELMAECEQIRAHANSIA